MAIVDIKDFSLSFGANQVLNNINLKVEEGSFTALVGESGSGKSVLALSILQLVNPTAQSGEIFFDGENVTKMPKKKLQKIRGDKVGMIFQEPMTSLNPLHSIGKQIAETLKIYQPSLKDLKARVQELLVQVGLSELKDRLKAYPHQLSGGQRQRVMIAMAIANSPDLLIADEPTTALDVIVAGEVLQTLKRLQTELGMAVLFISHDLTIVKNMSDNVYVMQNGNVVETGKTKEVFINPKHPYTKHLLASEPKGEAVKTVASPPVVMRAEGLTVSFPKTYGFFGGVKEVFNAVDNVSVSVAEGKTLGIVGESGSGKTTLGMALLRLVESTGQIGFAGTRIDKFSKAQMREYRKNMQVVFQDPFASLNPRMTVQEIVQEGPHAHGIEADVEKLLADVGLDAEMAQRYPHEFSGGQRQRICIARALSLRPRFILLDEPTSALDVSIESEIIDLLKKLQQKYHISYIFVSHDLRAVRAIAHDVAVMQAGKIVEYGTAKEIFSKPKSAYTKKLIKAAFLNAA
jgi:microcin C transport system ATP-binding protein